MVAAARQSQPQPVYRPRGAALDLMYCKAPEILMDGPAGTGKTRAILEKAHICLHKYPGCRALAVRKTRRSMTHSVLVTYEEKVLPQNSPIKNGAKRQMRDSYVYPNGSELVIGGMDDPAKIMSTEYDLILCFEWTEGSEDDHEKLTTRLRNAVMPYQQLIADCNPAAPSHWLNQRCVRGLMTRLLSRHEDNPTVTAEYLSTLARLTGARGLRLWKGLWAAQEGMVYADYDPAIHLISEMPKGWELWRKIRSIDFGFMNPFVCQWWAIDPDTRLYLYREIYMSQRTVAVHAHQINVLSGDEVHEATVADHDAEDRATLAENGIDTIPASKAISVGIQKTQERYKKAGDGRPRIFLLRDCCVEIDPVLLAARQPTSTQGEIEGYVWPPGATGKNNKEVPVDADNHGMDGKRYAVMYADNPIKPWTRDTLAAFGGNPV